MKKTLLTAIGVIALAASSHAAVLVAGWDFQTTTNGGTATVAAPSTPTSYVANFGTGTLFLNGTNGSSTFITTTGTNQLNSATGTAVNAGTGFSTTTSGAAAMLLTNASASSILNKTFVFSFNMTGLSSLTMSYAAQASSGNAATNSTLWEYSTNGTTWTTIQSVTVTAAFATYTLNTITGLDNVSTAYVRGTVTGASSGGTIRYDNIQLNAVPEPGTAAMALGGVGAMFWIIRRKRTIKA